MRQGQNRRMRGRNRNPGGGGNNSGNKTPNPLTRSYESNGPDVKVRGNAQTIAEKYMQLARDAHSSGDPVAAESYYQHAEHYVRIVMAAHEQMRLQFGDSYRPARAIGQDDQDDEDGEDGEDTIDPGIAAQPGQRDALSQSDGEETDEGERGQDRTPARPQDRNQPRRFDRPDRDRNDRDRNDRDRNDRRPERPLSDRSQNDRPQGERPPYRDRYERAPDRSENRFARNDAAPDQGDRAPRRFDRPRDDRPRDDRPRDDQPREERSFEPRGRDDRPRDDRPRDERPRDDRPRDDRPRDDRPREERPRSDRTREDRPASRPAQDARSGTDPVGDAAALPAFLTAPVRTVAPEPAVRENKALAAPAPVDAARLDVAPAPKRRGRPPKAKEPPAGTVAEPAAE